MLEQHAEEMGLACGMDENSSACGTTEEWHLQCNR